MKIRPKLSFFHQNIKNTACSLTVTENNLAYGEKDNSLQHICHVSEHLWPHVFPLNLLPSRPNNESAFYFQNCSRSFSSPTALLSSVCSQLLLATGAFPGRGPAWPSHVKRGPRVSEDMPSATWAPANSAELRWEQLGLEHWVQVQRGREREG